MSSEFEEKVYSLIKKIPKGKVSTYGAIAKKLDSSPRAVGNALRKNPYVPFVPCHRVIKSDGSIGGFKGKTSGKAIKEKIVLLRKENVKINRNKVNKIFCKKSYHFIFFLIFFISFSSLSLSRSSLYLFLIVTSVTPATSATSLWVRFSPFISAAT